MLFEYLKNFDLSKLCSIRIICNKYEYDVDDFYELCHFFTLLTYDFDVIYSLADLFNSFSIESIEHDIIDGQLILMVIIYE